MALHKVKPTEFGVDVTYWRIVQTNVDWFSRFCTIMIAGWVSREARLSGSSPMAYQTFTFDSDHFPFSGPDDGRPLGDIVSTVYLFIRYYPGWEDATNILEEDQAPVEPDPPPDDPPPDDPPPVEPETTALTAKRRKSKSS